ncbi:MAG TPA: hypothetical protein VG817_05225, partial [Gemmatimonadales bacterium]|nr:hypothetical protein [Gemmatimonadales bacterium]
NYMLEPKAIAALYKQVLSEGAPSMGEIEAWLDAHRWDREYFDQAIEKGSLSEGEWFVRVDGARLLTTMTSQLSGSRLVYRKAEHAPVLTELILKDSPSHFDEIVQALSPFISTDAGSSKAGEPSVAE